MCQLDEHTDFESPLVLKGKSFDNIPYEKLCRRANGLPPRTDYVCVDTRTFYEKWKFWLQVSVVFVILCIVDYVCY